ncbi:VOC family protein [Streptomyces sp. NBC_01618]|uniref:VOC family protein n=1 Tax=Streptomyces sp. NBC_01618 TaxID=2975900 RepID=UPI003870A570|nr:VOC family protein [Streptomyces sp. NBC_01618]
MGYDIARLHHVGHVVEDMAQAITHYERLGFRVPPPSCPAMPLHEGGTPEPFGTGNTHADFPHSFLELVARIEDGATDRLPADARLVPLEAPAEALPGLVERIRETSANVAACLDRFEGLHILMCAISPAPATCCGKTGSLCAKPRSATSSYRLTPLWGPLSLSARPLRM